MFEFFRCVAESVLEQGIKGLVEMAPGGNYVYAVAEGALKKWQEKRKAEKLREEIVEIANCQLEKAKDQAVEAVREAVEKVAMAHGGPSPTQVEMESVQAYVSGIPESVRQSLKRTEDPTGRTVPNDYSLRNAEDIVKLLPARPPKFRPGQSVPGKNGWIVDELLGVGGFGEVWHARHERMASLHGAIKFCLGQTGRDLIHEAGLIDRVMAAGPHPNIVPLKDLHLEGDTPWLMFDYISGGTLTDWMHTLAGMAPDARLKQVTAALRQLAGAMAHFHSLPKPIVHRDLKPSNILLDRSTNTLRVTDFGIGSVTARETHRQERTGQSQRGGHLLSCLRGSHTPVYSSPQQRRGDLPDPRDDVHALGVISYQMLTCRLDTGPGPGAAKKLKQQNVPQPLVDLIVDCTSEELNDRPADGKALLERLTEIGTPADPPPQAANTSGKPSTSHGLSQPAEPAVKLPPAPKEIPTTISIDLGKGVNLDMVLIPSGTFMMGSPESEKWRSANEKLHQVTISKPFFLAKYPVTQAQWRAVMGNYPSHFEGDTLPVEQVSWDDCQEFVKKLNQMQKITAFRLPTEAEWEYACRAGSTTAYGYGDNPDILENYAWYNKISDGTTHQVGQKKPNAWGLYDMHGNVWEWCKDWFDDYATGAISDPTGPQVGFLRVVRGGGWGQPAGGCRSANRNWGIPGFRSDDLSFRVSAGPS